MVLIIKMFGQKVYKIVKFSNIGYSNECRLLDLINQDICYDDINRIQFYRAIIDKLISEGQNIRPFSSDDVTNTLHDRIVRHFSELGIEVYLVELSEQVFPFI
jgi:hypothetical protein